MLPGAPPWGQHPPPLGLAKQTFQVRSVHCGAAVCAQRCGGDNKNPWLPFFPGGSASPAPSYSHSSLADQQGGGPLAAALLQCLFKGSVRNKDLPAGLGRQLLYVN